jgi:hypothetical protein
MKQAEFSVLKKRVEDVTHDSPVGGRIKNIVIEADDDGTGSDFLRVILETASLDDVNVEDLIPVVESIETALLELDDRFPSVRFADAA